MNQVRAVACNSSVELEIENRVGESFIGDAYLLNHIIVNLMENGVIFRGTDDPFVRCVLSVEQQVLTIQVSDNGTGISPDLKDRMFEMFYRGSERSIGNGLGLFMVKESAGNTQRYHCAGKRTECIDHVYSKYQACLNCTEAFSSDMAFSSFTSKVHSFFGITATTGPCLQLLVQPVLITCTLRFKCLSLTQLFICLYRCLPPRFCTCSRSKHRGYSPALENILSTQREVNKLRDKLKGAFEPINRPRSVLSSELRHSRSR